MPIMFWYAETMLCMFYFCWTHSIIDMSITRNYIGVGSKHAVQKGYIFEKDLEKGCLEVDWSKNHFTRARHLHRIWQAQIQNENVPHVIYGDFEFLTTKTEQKISLTGSPIRSTSPADWCFKLSIHLRKLQLHIIFTEEGTVWINLLTP